MSGAAGSIRIHKSEWWALKVQERMEEKSIATHVLKCDELWCRGLQTPDAYISQNDEHSRSRRGCKRNQWLGMCQSVDQGDERTHHWIHTYATFGINQGNDKELLNKLNFPVFRPQQVIPTGNMDHLLLLYLSIFKFLSSEPITTCLISLCSCVLLNII